MAVFDNHAVEFPDFFTLIDGQRNGMLSTKWGY